MVDVPYQDGLKTAQTGITWVSVKSLNAQVKIGNQSRNIKLPIGQSDLAVLQTKATGIYDLLNPRTLGNITGRSMVTHRNDDADIPADITGKHNSEVFTFRENRGGVESYPKVIVPFYTGAQALGTADKAVVGQSMATLLSGDLATYSFIS